MPAFRGLVLTRVPPPDTAQHRAWMHEAADQGFNRATCLRLCWQRWLWRWVAGYGPERRTR